MPVIRQLTRPLTRPLTRTGTEDRAASIFYSFLAALNAHNASPLTTLRGTAPTQIGTSAVVVPNAAGTLITIAGGTPGNPAIPWAAYSGGNWSDTSVTVTKTQLISGLSRYSGGPSLNPSLGVLFGPAASNLLLQSNAFTTTWTTTGTPAVNQNVTGPDGAANTAWTVTDSNATVLASVRQAVALTAGTKYAFSVYIKKTVGAQATYPVIVCEYPGPKTSLATIDTTNGIATVWTAYTGFTILPSSASCVSSGDYWRVTLVVTPADTISHVFAVYSAATTNATQSTGTITASLQGSAVIYGAQVETSASGVATTYIPTTTGTVTRAARYLTMAGTDLGKKTRLNLVSNEAHGRVFRILSDGTRMLYHDGTNLVFTDGSTTIQAARALVAGTAYQIGLDTTAGAWNLYVNGVSVATSAAGAAVTWGATVYVGSSTTGTNVLNGYVTCIESSDDPNFSAGGTT